MKAYQRLIFQATSSNFQLGFWHSSIKLLQGTILAQTLNPKSRGAFAESEAETMSYDDVEIEDMEWNEELQAYTYPCPCGDLFQITRDDLKLGEEIARCPSCSLYITVIYNIEDFLDKKSNKPLEPSKQQPITVA
ncbi:DPH3 homolog [Pyrus x bretschneideri]|nr:DPH3 homolog [Pyrus x bretschneideri]